MKFNICSNIQNSYGLEKDYRILRRLLESWGHEVNGVQINGLDSVPVDVPDADVNIFFELLSSKLIASHKATENWFVPNPEWYYSSWDSTLSQVDKVLCKTYEAVRIFSQKVKPDKCIHVGWESEDFYDPSVPRRRKFLHVAGGSGTKNTLAVACAFSKFFYNPFALNKWNDKESIPFVLVSCQHEWGQMVQGRGNCIYIKRAGETELKHLMNECLFHIMPSVTEGWGHVIHEGLSCGAVMLTTDFPPMNEYAGISKDLLVSSKMQESTGAARSAWVGAIDVKVAVEKAWQLDNTQIEQIQKNAREAFLDQRECFRQKLREVVAQ